MLRSRRWRLALMAATIVALLAPLGVAQARWKVIASRAVDPMYVCTDGIIFAFADEFWDEFSDYSAYPSTSRATFRAASPVPPDDPNGGYLYPAPETIVAVHRFNTYLFTGDPWGADTSNPPDGVDDVFLVYKGVAGVRWNRLLNPGDEVLLTFADFSPFEVSPIEVVQDCRLFTVDIRTSTRHSKYPGGSRTILEVAVLRQPGVNPLHIIGSSVRFGPTGVEAAPIGSRYVDVDRDGDTDRVFQFDAGLLRSLCTNRLGILTAQLSTGGAFIGADTLWASQCRSLGI